MQICSFGPSLWFSIILSILYANSALALLLSTLPWLVKLFLLAILVYFYLKQIKIEALRTSCNSIVTLWSNEKFWYLLTQKQTRYKLKLTQQCYCSNLFIILALATNNKKKKTVVIPRDALTEEEYRYIAAKIQVYAA